jgi:hypothetical protein
MQPNRGLFLGVRVLTVIGERTHHRDPAIGISRAFGNVGHLSFPSYLYPKIKRHLIDVSPSHPHERSESVAIDDGLLSMRLLDGLFWGKLIRESHLLFKKPVPASLSMSSKMPMLSYLKRLIDT